MTPQAAPAQTFVSEYDAIVNTMKGYVDGVRAGRSELMRPAFHPAATFFGHYPGGVMEGPVQPLFDWIDGNGPAPNIESRIVNVEILGTIAYVRLELEGREARRKCSDHVGHFHFDDHRRRLENRAESISLALIDTAADPSAAPPS